MKKYNANDTIRYKMILHPENWIEHLTTEECKLCELIWKANEDALLYFKKEYPDLCFILQLKKIEFQNSLSN